MVPISFLQDFYFKAKLYLSHSHLMFRECYVGGVENDDGRFCQKLKISYSDDLYLYF